MAIEIKVPQLPESVADATIATWHVKPGDKVSRDQNLVDIETDKVVLEVSAPADGVLGEIIADEGTTVNADEVIGKIDEGDDSGSDSDDSDSDSDDNGKEEKKEKKSDNGDDDSSDESSDDEEKDGEEVKAKTSKKSGSDEKFELKVPDLPESVSDATIAVWHVKAGDKVKRDQNLVDIETDKVVLEVVAPADGVLEEIKEEEGATVGAGDVIGIVSKGDSGDSNGDDKKSSKSEEKSDDSKSESDDSDDDKEVTGPAVRRLLSEHDLKASDVKGTGKGGRVTKEDVQKHIKEAKESKDKTSPGTSTSTSKGDRDEKRVPMTRLRKTIAKRLLEAKNATAMLTTFNEVNMKPIMDLRKKYKDVFEERHGTRMGFMGFYVKAVTEALKRFPEVNASIDGDDIVYHNYFDISIAVSTPRGLVTPVLRDTDKMGMADVEKGIRDLAGKGRDGKLTMDDMQGGNFTITNGGVFGSLLSTPILNLPQSAILGMHKIQDRAMVVDGKIEVLPMMYLALSYDHRIVDGKESVGFLVTIKELLEDPQRLLLDV